MSARAAARGGATFAVAAVFALASSALAAPPPAQDYALECRGCHGPTGEGTPTVPSLVGVARFLGTPRGRAYLVRVPGVAASQLSDARVAALLNWVLRELATNPRAPRELAPFDAREVAAARARKLLDPSAERAAIVDAPRRP